MMTGAAGVVIWLMMGLMVAAMAGGAIAWARRASRRHATQRPEPQGSRATRAAGGADPDAQE